MILKANGKASIWRLVKELQFKSKGSLQENKEKPIFEMKSEAVCWKIPSCLGEVRFLFYLAFSLLDEVHLYRTVRIMSDQISGHCGPIKLTHKMN